MIRPVGKNIVAKEGERETKTAGGILLQQAATTGLQPGKVIAVGPEVENVEVGQTIYVRWSEAHAVTIDGEQCAIVEERFVLGIQE